MIKSAANKGNLKPKMKMTLVIGNNLYILKRADDEEHGKSMNEWSKTKFQKFDT